MTKKKSQGSKLNDLTKIPMHKSDPESANKFFEELEKASDRAGALLAVSAVDEILVETLLNHFRPISEEEARKQFFAKGANFGSLSIRADLCFLLGLIDEETKHDIDVLRQIRNAFAHSTAPLSFDTEEVREAIAKMRYVQNVYPDGTPREQFTSCCFAYHVDMMRKLSENFDLALKALPTILTIKMPE